MWRKIETLCCGFWTIGKGISQYIAKEGSCMLLIANKIIYISNEISLKSVIDNISRYRQP
jgi:hypothetical protein